MDGIIFDVDGTLWDSTEVVAKSWNQALAAHTDIPPTLTAESITYLFGKTMDVICAELFPSYSLEEQTKLGALCFEYENRLLVTEPGILYAGVEETFAALAQKHNLYIVSNCQCGYIEILLETTGLGRYVKDHLCYGDTLLPKSKTIQMLMERNTLEHVVYVGDTIGDYTACIDANIPFIYAAYGFGDVPEAKTQIESISQLLDIL